MTYVNRNIYNAKFNSIATIWIRAYNLIEIDNYSRLVKKPKAEERNIHRISGTTYYCLGHYGHYRVHIYLGAGIVINSEYIYDFSHPFDLIYYFPEGQEMEPPGAVRRREVKS